MTAVKPNITRDQLLELLRYEPETGKLYWRERGAHLFQAGDGPRYTADNVALRWNIRHAGREAFTSISNGYFVTAIFNRQHSAHRVIWLMVYGELPETIDHINGVKTDNRIVNLRSATSAQNAHNRKLASTNKSGVHGVIFIRQFGKWRAQIGGGATRVYLGHYDTKEEAIAARKAAETYAGYHPNHGRTNPSSR